MRYINKQLKRFLQIFGLIEHEKIGFMSTDIPIKKEGYLLKKSGNPFKPYIKHWVYIHADSHTLTFGEADSVCL